MHQIENHWAGDDPAEGESVKLKNQGELSRVDHSGMIGLIAGFPDQLRRAVKLSEHAQAPAADYRNVVLLGMGGSAIGGDLLRILLEAENGRVPVIVSRDYQCPAFVGEHTLCIAASYSGNTEETLSAADEAFNRGAKVVAVTSGGTLKNLCEKRGAPVAEVPGGQPPRSALGFMFVPALQFVRSAGLCRDFGADLDESLSVCEEVVRRNGPDVPEQQNQAKRLAVRLRRTLPVIYGSSPATAVVALRWKCQFNENAKRHALANGLPELDHNEVCGWRGVRYAPSLRWIFLRDRNDSPQHARRVEVTRSILAERALGCTDIWGEGKSLLARLFSLIVLGDLVTAYVAIISAIDPTDIREIDVLKQELSQ